MRLASLFIICFISLSSIAQTEGQGFCDDFPTESYLPLSIEKKKLVWGNTFYIEERLGTKTFHGREYVEFKQTWRDERASLLYLREENGVVYQYEDRLSLEWVRFDDTFKKGDTWMKDSELMTYTIVSTKGKLSTPFCDYKKLVVIKAEWDTGNYLFYYKKGYGYVGATTLDKELISYASPKWD